MERYWIYLIAAVLILSTWIFLGWFVYTKTKIRLTKREIYLLLFVLGLVAEALVFTYFQASGTFRW